jgi:hypothetical protein
MILEKDVIKILDNEYTVVSTLNLDNNKYAYIINNNNFNEVLFIKSTKKEIEVIKEKKLLKELIKLFNMKINEQKLIDLC